MANLVIDIGNTQAKLAVFNGSELLWFNHYKHPQVSEITEVVKRYQVELAIVSSVKPDEQWVSQLADIMPVKRFDRLMVKHIKNHYRTPNTLGVDRLAAVAGASAAYPEENNLVIDAGSCITYDMVDAGSNYYGGSISPGLSMRFKAMNHYTAALPLLEPDMSFAGKAGDDTMSAMRSGVQNGIKYEVMGFVQSYREQYPALNVILTGGDAIFLDTVLKNSIFAPYIKIDPYLVLRGLNAVIQHND